MAHLLKELNYFQKRYKSMWAKKCKNLFMRAIAIKKEMNPEEDLNHQPQRSLIETDMDELLSMDEITRIKKPQHSKNE